MTTKRKIEVFSAGCALCDDTVSRVRELACPSCEVTVLDMREAASLDRARELGVATVPAVAVDGTLAACCTGKGPDEATLRAAGLGRPVG